MIYNMNKQIELQHLSVLGNPQIRVRVDLGTSWLRYELTRVRVDSGTSWLGYELTGVWVDYVTWVRQILFKQADPKELGVISQLETLCWFWKLYPPINMTKIYLNWMIVIYKTNNECFSIIRAIVQIMFIRWKMECSIRSTRPSFKLWTFRTIGIALINIHYLYMSSVMIPQLQYSTDRHDRCCFFLWSWNVLL